MEDLLGTMMPALILIFILASILVFIISGLPGSTYLIEAEPAWTPISRNRHNMVAFGHVHIDEADPGQGRLILYSFGPGGEHDCRSRCDIGPDGAYYATIRGNIKGEFISFRVYDYNNGKTYDLKGSIPFEIDAVVENFDIRVR